MSDFIKDILDENLGELIRERRGNYLVVNAVSKRVRQLQTGDRYLALPADGSRDPVRIALQELLDDKLEVLPRISGRVLEPGEEYEQAGEE
jgi:DNA-directed RNA polymerase subunit K/omega